MITITITISKLVATLLVVFALLILACFIWVIKLLTSISDDCLNLNYIDQRLNDFFKKFYDETKK